MNQMKAKYFFNNYFLEINKRLNCVDINKLEEISDLLVKASKNNNKIIIVGNGGSAAIASHVTVDFINAARIKAINFNESSIITCFANDYGYENWVEKALECYAESGDVVILISSSGQSKNILAGANKANSMNVGVITLSGFLQDNPLRKLGNVNLWVDSRSYNIVEMTHHIWLLSVIDYVIANKEAQG